MAEALSSKGRPIDDCKTGPISERLNDAFAHQPLGDFAVVDRDVGLIARVPKRHEHAGIKAMHTVNMIRFMSMPSRTCEASAVTVPGVYKNVSIASYSG